MGSTAFVALAISSASIETRFLTTRTVAPGNATHQRIPRLLRNWKRAPPIPPRRDVGGSETRAVTNGVAAS